MWHEVASCVINKILTQSQMHTCVPVGLQHLSGPPTDRVFETVVYCLHLHAWWIMIDTLRVFAVVDRPSHSWTLASSFFYLQLRKEESHDFSCVRVTGSQQLTLQWRLAAEHILVCLEMCCNLSWWWRVFLTRVTGITTEAAALLRCLEWISTNVETLLSDDAVDVWRWHGKCQQSDLGLMSINSPLKSTATVKLTRAISVDLN